MSLPPPSLILSASGAVMGVAALIITLVMRRRRLRRRPRIEMQPLSISHFQCQCGCNARGVALNVADGAFLLESEEKVQDLIEGLEAAKAQVWPEPWR